jgi:hypothetical protein
MNSSSTAIATGRCHPLCRVRWCRRIKLSGHDQRDLVLERRNRRLDSRGLVRRLGRRRRRDPRSELIRPQIFRGEGIHADGTGSVASTPPRNGPCAASPSAEAIGRSPAPTPEGTGRPWSPRRSRPANLATPIHRPGSPTFSRSRGIVPRSGATIGRHGFGRRAGRNRGSRRPRLAPAFKRQLRKMARQDGRMFRPLFRKLAA